MLSISSFARRIQNVTTFQLFRQNGEWVTSPDNQGRAQVAGIEMDAKFPLTLWFAQAPAIDIRLNAARNWSRLDSVPGPDNRLSSQVPLTANLGMDYRRTDTHSMGLNFNFQGGGRVQNSALLSSYTSVTRMLDLYSLWKLASGTQLRVSLTNALHQTAVADDTYMNQGSQTRSVATPRQTGVRLLLEKVL
jgi:outer membrane receptor for ferrienterochelin and colicin